MDLSTIPGARMIDGFSAPSDIDAPYPTPFGDNPPIDWFLTPHPLVEPGTTGVITADGQFCAYSHEWDRCHNGYTSAGECWTPPPSVTQNRYFHQSTVITAEGVQIPTGVIPLGEGHADIDLDIYQAMAHYDRPERVTVRARAVETDHGVVMCGALVPGVTHHQVAVMRAAALSGDWRWVPELGAMEFLGPCFVARPGLPLGLESMAASAAPLWDTPRLMRTSEKDGHLFAAVTTPASWEPRTIVETVTASAAPCSCQHPPEPVTAHATDSAAISVLSQQVEDLATIVEGLAGDVARLSANHMDPADLVAELPQAPTIV